MSQPIKSICVFCGSHVGDSPLYKEAADGLAREFVKRGIRLVYGGGSVGMMGVIAEAVLSAGGEVVGILPESIVERELPHQGRLQGKPGKWDLRIVRSLEERKRTMFDLSEAFLTLPGGFGTLDECFEMITWKQIGLHKKPVVLVNIGGYYDSLLEFIGQAVRSGFITEERRKLFTVAPTVSEALSQLESLDSAQA